MRKMLRKNGWLLASGGFFNAILAAIYFSHIGQGFHSQRDILFSGRLMLAAGICTAAAGLWRSAMRGKLLLRNSRKTVAVLSAPPEEPASSIAVWRRASAPFALLVLHGIALSVLGLILNGLFGWHIRFRTVALLVISMAITLGLFTWACAQTRPRLVHARDRVVLFLAGVISIGFATAFFVLAFGGIKIEPGSYLDLRWLGAYFAFSAVCMFGLSLRLNSQGRLYGLNAQNGSASAQRCDDDSSNVRRSELHEGLSQGSLRWRPRDRGVVL